LKVRAGDCAQIDVLISSAFESSCATQLVDTEIKALQILQAIGERDEEARVVELSIGAVVRNFVQLGCTRRIFV
jgi:hypothetical protein